MVNSFYLPEAQTPAQNYEMPGEAAKTQYQVPQWQSED